MIVRRDETALRQLAWRRLLLFIGLAGTFTACIFIFGRQILSLYGDKYVAAYPATCIIAAGTSFTTLFSVAPYFLQFIERDRLALSCTAGATALSFVLYIVLGSQYGEVGAALAYAIPVCLLFAVTRVLAEFYGMRHMGETPDEES